MAFDETNFNRGLTWVDNEEYPNFNLVIVYLRSALFFIRSLRRIVIFNTEKMGNSSLISREFFVESCLKNVNGITSTIMYYIYQIGRNIEKILFYCPSLIIRFNDRIKWEIIVNLGYDLKKEMVNVEHIELWNESFSKLLDFLIIDLNNLFFIFTKLTKIES